MSFSCSSINSEVKNVGVPENYVIDLEEAIEENDLEIEPVTLTPLSQPLDFNGFSDHLKLEVRENIFYVFDIKQQFLMVYDSLGNAIQKIGNKGRGPGEFSGVIDYAVSKDEVVFLKKAGNNLILITFDKAGNYMREEKIPVSGMSLARFGSGDHLVFTGWNNKIVPNKLYRIDHVTRELTGFFPHEFEEPKIPIEGDTFTGNNGSIYFLETLKPEIFKVTENNELKLYAYIDQGDFEIDTDFWSMEPMKAMESLIKKGFYHCGYFWITEDLIGLEGWVTKDNGESQDIFLAIHQINTGITKAKILKLGTIDQLLLDIFQINDSRLYSLGDGYAIKELELEHALDIDVEVSDTTYYLVKSELRF
ncbi:MAG: 6-bladed beta-propeller [Cyclobacteriaceae bacterium]